MPFRREVNLSVVYVYCSGAVLCTAEAYTYAHAGNDDCSSAYAAYCRAACGYACQCTDYAGYAESCQYPACGKHTLRFLPLLISGVVCAQYALYFFLADVFIIEYKFVAEALFSSFVQFSA